MHKYMRAHTCGAPIEKTALHVRMRVLFLWWRFRGWWLVGLKFNPKNNQWLFDSWSSCFSRNTYHAKALVCARLKIFNTTAKHILVAMEKHGICCSGWVKYVL